jgi:hypothetical protein
MLYIYSMKYTYHMHRIAEDILIQTITCQILILVFRNIILPKLYSSFILFEPPRYSWNLLKVALNTTTPILIELINWIYFYTQKIFSNSKVWWNVILNLDIYDILKRNASHPQYRYYKKYSLFLLESKT